MKRLLITVAALALVIGGAAAEDLASLKSRAEQGDAYAQNSLGKMYYVGDGVPQDYAEAAKWWRSAAGLGFADAQVSLGEMYYVGDGVPQDYAEAAKWWRSAAEQGLADAQALLGALYGTGNGVPRDYVEAHKWLNLAASSGTWGARETRDAVASQMTPKQIAEAQKLAREWVPKSK